MVLSRIALVLLITLLRSCPLSCAECNDAELLQGVKNFAGMPQDFQGLFLKLSRGLNLTSGSCQDAFISVIRGLQKGEEWALSMVDSSGKPRSGILEGALTWTGSFYQCLDVRARTNQQEFEGQYCMVTMDISYLVNISNLRPVMLGKLERLNYKLKNTLYLRLGLCVPSICSNVDIKYAVESIGGHNSPVKVFCGTKKSSQITASMCIFIIVIVGFILFASMATYFDITHSQENKDTDTGRTLKAFLVFSVCKSSRFVMTTSSQREKTLGCLNGIRVLSILWIVLIHSTGFIPSYLFDAPLKKELSTNLNTMFALVKTGLFAVDTFLFLGGFLVAYPLLLKMKKPNSKFNIGLFYFLRWWRLTPVYVVALWMTYLFFPLWINGPFADEAIGRFGDCHSNWWTNVLYINNFVHTNGMCISHSWYLACEMQMFFISPIILYPLAKSPGWGLLLNFAFLTSSMVVPTVLTVIFEYPPYAGIGYKKINEFYREIYIKPYCRMVPYCCGIFVAYFLTLKSKNLIIKNWLKVTGWILVLILCYGVIIGMPTYIARHPSSVIASALYAGCSKLCWSLFLSWIVINCVTGNAGIINSILAFDAFAPMSRIAYCLYLVHPAVLYVNTGNILEPIHFSHHDSAELYFSTLVISTFLAVILTLLFEMPFMRIPQIMKLDSIYVLDAGDKNKNYKENEINCLFKL